MIYWTLPAKPQTGDICIIEVPWWRHQMETFSALLAICAGNSPVPGEFLAQRPVTRSFDVFCDLRLNKRLSKHSWGWWFETPPWSLWRHRNAVTTSQQKMAKSCLKHNFSIFFANQTTIFKMTDEISRDTVTLYTLIFRNHVPWVILKFPMIIARSELFSW